jgi:MFS family permease
MLPLELFRNGTYTGSNLVVLLVALAMFGVFFFVSLYMQNILGYSAVQTGAAFLPMTILIILIAPIAGRASDRIGSRGLMTAGMILIAVQLVFFSRLTDDASFWNLLPAFMIGGIGMALTMTPSAAAATRSVPVDKAGVGAAVLNSARQVGGTMGIAVMGAIMASATGDVRTPDAFMDGFQKALLVAAGIAVVGAVVAYALVRPHEGRGHRVERGAAEPAA